jgi:hypothetical protein
MRGVGDWGGVVALGEKGLDMLAVASIEADGSSLTSADYIHLYTYDLNSPFLGPVLWWWIFWFAFLTFSAALMQDLRKDVNGIKSPPNLRALQRGI